MARRYDDDPALVLAAQAGDQAAFTTLFQRWFDPCFDVARRIVHNDDTAAEVAQETFLVAWRQLDTLRDASAFGGWVLRTSRNKALNRLERERRSVAVDQDADPALAELEAVSDVAGEVQRSEQQQLVWAAAAALGAREASVLDLHLRHGLDASEIALALDVTPNNAHQLLFRMKAKLAGGIRAWVLFKGGDPQCEELGRALHRAEARSFSAATVKVIDKHVASCDECQDRQAAILAPEAMFAAVPLLPVAPGLQGRVAEALRSSGVPLGPNAAQPVAAADGAGSSGSGSSGSGSSGSGSSSSDAGASGPVAEPAPVAVVDAPVPPVALVAPTATDDDGSPAKVLVAVAIVALLVLLVGGWALLSGGTEESDVAAGAVDVVTTTVVGDPRSGTSRPNIEREITTPSTTTDGVPSTIDSGPEVPGSSTVPPPSTTAPTSSPTTLGPTPTTAPAPPPTTAPAPVIDSFGTSNQGVGGACASPTAFSVTLTWSTTDATSVSWSSPDGVTGSSGPDGSAVACSSTPSATWTLTAIGPGGTATATA